MPASSVLTAPYRLLLADATTEDFYEDDLMSMARKGFKQFLEMSMDLELTERIGCSRYDRSPDRRALRNGYYQRDLVTGFGILEGLRVPRCRDGEYRPTLLERYRRRTAHVDRVVRSLFFAGVSTRAVSEVLEVLMGFEPSAAGVSRIVRQLDMEVAMWHRRPVADHYVYLFLDGISMTLKEAPTAVRRMVLVAYGITAEGRRELIDYHVAPSESSTEWERFLTSMMDRGLKGENLQLITTDGGTGLRAALQTVFPRIGHQLCWAHKMRNVANNLKKEHEQLCISQARRIYLAPNRRAALEAWKEWKSAWETVAPKAVACLAKDLEALLTFLRMPAEHRTAIRTTNYIERQFREVRRRTRPMGAFSDRPSCDRLLYGIFKRLTNRLAKRKPLKGFTHNS